MNRKMKQPEGCPMHLKDSNMSRLCGSAPHCVLSRELPAPDLPLPLEKSDLQCIWSVNKWMAKGPLDMIQFQRKQEHCIALISHSTIDEDVHTCPDDSVRTASSRWGPKGLRQEGRLFFFFRKELEVCFHS